MNKRNNSGRSATLSQAAIAKNRKVRQRQNSKPQPVPALIKAAAVLLPQPVQPEAVLPQPVQPQPDEVPTLTAAATQAVQNAAQPVQPQPRYCAHCGAPLSGTVTAAQPQAGRKAAPVTRNMSPSKDMTSGSAAAYKAHRTRLQQQLKGASAPMKRKLHAMIAEYNRKLQNAGAE